MNSVDPIFLADLSKDNMRLSADGHVSYGPVEIRRMILSAPPLRSNADLQESSLAFRSYSSDLDELELSVDLPALRTLCSGAGSGGALLLKDACVSGDSLELFFCGANPAQPFALVSKWRIVPAKSRAVQLVRTGVLGLGFLDTPWEQALDDWFLRHGGPVVAREETGYSLDFLGRLLDSVFLGQGRRTPRSRVALASIEGSGGRLVLLFLRSTAGAVVEQPAEVDNRELFSAIHGGRVLRTKLELLQRGQRSEVLGELYGLRASAELDDTLRPLLMQLQLAAPGLHKDLAEDCRTALENPGLEAVARACQAGLALYSGDSRGFCAEVLELATILAGRERKAAAAFLVAEAVRMSAGTGQVEAKALLAAAERVLPRQPAILQATLEVAAQDLDTAALLEALPFVKQIGPQASAAVASRLLGEGRWKEFAGLLEAQRAVPENHRALILAALNARLPAELLPPVIASLRDLEAAGGFPSSADEATALAGFLTAAGQVSGLEPALQVRLMAGFVTGAAPRLSPLLAGLVSRLDRGQTAELLAWLEQREAGAAGASALLLAARLRLGLYAEAVRGLAGTARADELLRLLLGAFEAAPAQELASQLILWLDGNGDRRLKAMVSGHLGLWFQSQGRPELAVDYLSAAAREERGPGRVFEALLDCAQESGRLPEIQDLVQAELATMPDAPRVARLHLAQSRAFAARRRYEAAAASLQRAERLIPLAPEMLVWKAELAGLQGDMPPVRQPLVPDRREQLANQARISYFEAVQLADGRDGGRALAILDAILEDLPDYAPALELRKMIAAGPSA